MYGLFDNRLELKLLESVTTWNDVISNCKMLELAVSNKKLFNVERSVNCESRMRTFCYVLEILYAINHYRRCGGIITGQLEQYCPALMKGANCYTRGKLGHLKSVCRAQRDVFKYNGWQNDNHELNTGYVNALYYEETYFDSGNQINQRKIIN